ncbi:hypothetical protein NBRC110019_20480 [Neptunitalea chrysea]|uniref:DUF3857 domain-containing protein n=1 Tax=Neptunitalea chrysea TaxID=1647581 RepID=A0A9W6B8P8_9FLAO|nr:hypothetical protein [Neptunitalea chrysea]GLB53008.1 hypothetical protein NBRC110019_20480 [Neptunitalea chrysea]
MKLFKLLALLLLLPCIGIAQSPGEMKKEVEKVFWGAKDQYKDATEVPEKWQGESAVILYKNVNFDYHKFAKKVTYKSSIRKRIKLMDAASVENYSDFSYKKFFKSSKGRRSKKSFTLVGVKIIKPDGSVERIDVDGDAVQQNDKYKVAIKNLEVGDIIDYYIYVVESFVSKYAVKFNPEEETLADDYPVVDYKLYLQTENDFFITFKSFNGAPELKQLKNDERNLRQYELVAHDIPKFESERYIFPLIQMPTYKFQTVFARSGKFEENTYAFLPKDESIIKNNVSIDEVKALYEEWLDVGKWQFDRYKKQSFSSDYKKVMDLYYFMRNYYITKNILAYIAYEKELEDPYLIAQKYPVTSLNNDRHFVNIFTSNLNKMGIGYDILVAKKRYDGPIDELLFTSNVNLVVKAHTNPPVYVEMFDQVSDANQLSPLLEGTDAFLLEFNKKKIVDIKKTAIPVSTPEDNVTTYVAEISLTDDTKGVQVKTSHSAIGHRKTAMQEYYLFYGDYEAEDALKYGLKPFVEYFGSKKKRARLEEGLKAIEDTYREKQNEWFTDGVKDFYDLGDELTDYTYNIEATGRFGKEQPMTYTETFNIKNNFVKKAGPNLIIELGKLMGNQIQIKDEDKTRDLDVYQKYPKTLITELQFNIPEGYEAKPVDNLNKKFENEAGSFTCEARIKGNQVIMKVTEIHAHNFETAANWPKLVDILNAAYEASNAKILLSKK